MPALKKPRHETFAQAIARGATLAEAHLLSGYSGSRSSACRLVHRPDVAERVLELRNTYRSIAPLAPCPNGNSAALQNWIEAALVQIVDSRLRDVASGGPLNMALVQAARLLLERLDAAGPVSTKAK